MVQRFEKVKIYNQNSIQWEKRFSLSKKKNISLKVLRQKDKIGIAGIISKLKECICTVIYIFRGHVYVKTFGSLASGSPREP